MTRPGPRRSVLALLTGLAAVGPALAEPAAVRAIDAEARRCTDDADGPCGGVGDVELDLHGLRLRDVWHRGRGHRFAADQVVIRPDWGGLRVDVEGLDAERTSAARRDDPPFDPPRAASASSPSPLPARRIPNRGIPLHVRAQGRIHAPLPGGATFDLVDPELHVDAEGRPRARFDAALHRGGVVVPASAVRAWPIDAAWTRLGVEGSVFLAERKPMAFAGEVGREALHFRGVDDAQGILRIEGSPGAGRLRVEAERFHLRALGDVLEVLDDRAGIDFAPARIDGAFELVADGERLRVHLDGAKVQGLVIDDDRLAREPVVFGEIAISGDASVVGVDDWSAQMVVDHAGAQVHLAATRDARRTALEVRLAPTDCQTVLDALPSAMRGPVAGTRLDGSIEGHLALTVSHEALHARRGGADPEASPPGTLDFAFPFLERCTVIEDAPDIDLAALAGPYRHRFVDDRGRPHVRVLAAGAPDYAPLSSIPLVARAFLTLEDARFWRHDGFDREQIERALWHNLQVGRISRGASTITQQTARNLWLGVDRSLSRKLQEALLTARLEAKVPKARILELYLNIIELGPGIHGVEPAARYHFGKSAAELTPLQAVHLAMLAPGPRLYSQRFRDGTIDDAWRQELHRQVRRMALHGHLTREQLRQALRSDLGLLPH